MATKIAYLDADTGSSQYGYIIDGKTYKDEAGTQRISEGSIVTTPDGKTYKMGADGHGHEYTGTAEALGIPTTGSSGSDSEGNYVDYRKSTADDYINSIYDAQIKAAEAKLKAAYDQNVNTLNAEKAKIPGTYATAKNQTAGQSETQRANFNEYAAASGLNSGAGGQASLSFSNQLQGNLASLNQAQADAAANIDLQLANLQTQYQADLAQAFAEGNLAKISALYDNYQTNRANMMSMRQMELSMNKETTLYKDQKLESEKAWALETSNWTGDYSGMAAYGWKPQQIASAEAEWKRVRETKT
jgi:hypothetical protein